MAEDFVPEFALAVKISQSSNEEYIGAEIIPNFQTLNDGNGIQGDHRSHEDPFEECQPFCDGGRGGHDRGDGHGDDHDGDR
ncbi:hypothetical protein AVEN_175854-1, partial [Araneus ventricosus]